MVKTIPAKAVIGSKWQVRALRSEYVCEYIVETVDDFFETRQDGKPKKNAKPCKARVSRHSNRTMAEHICTIHNVGHPPDDELLVETLSRKTRYYTKEILLTLGITDGDYLESILKRIFRSKEGGQYGL